MIFPIPQIAVPHCITTNHCPTCLPSPTYFLLPLSDIFPFKVFASLDKVFASLDKSSDQPHLHLHLFHSAGNHREIFFLSHPLLKTREREIANRGIANNPVRIFLGEGD